MKKLGKDTKARRTSFWRLKVQLKLWTEKMNTNGSQSKLEIPIGNSISKIQFAPHSNNLLISSWDTVSFISFSFSIFVNWNIHSLRLINFISRVFQCLRLYDFDASVLRLESPSEFALLDCCFTDEDTVAFAAASDGFIRRFFPFSILLFYLLWYVVERGKSTPIFSLVTTLMKLLLIINC